jgi:hypothetical protein
MVMIKSQRGEVSLGMGEEAFDESWIGFFLRMNSSKLLFKQVETEIL